MTPSETSDSPKAGLMADLTIPDEVQLLAEILTARSEGSDDSRAGTSDEDLLYAIEEAEAHLTALKHELERRTR